MSNKMIKKCKTQNYLKGAASRSVSEFFGKPSSKSTRNGEKKKKLLTFCRSFIRRDMVNKMQ